MTRKALGRGLGALLSADRETVLNDEPFQIDLDLIDPSPMQPRSRFDEARLNELSQSIQSNGVVQPLLVRKAGGRYELIAGERRWRAAKQAGLQKIPAIVKDVPDDKILELALIENIQREDLNPIEEAQAYQKLIETIGLTQESLAARVGRDRSYITNYLRLLRLPVDIQKLVQDGTLSTGHARTLLGADGVDVQRQIARRIIDQQLSVRETERLVRRVVEGPTLREKRASTSSVDPNIRAAETKLQRRLGTRVRIISQGDSEKGRIEIEFYGHQDLDRIYRILLSGSEVSAAKL